MREAKQMGAQKRVGVHEGGVNGGEEEVGDLVLGFIREIGWVSEMGNEQLGRGKGSLVEWRRRRVKELWMW